MQAELQDNPSNTRSKELECLPISASDEVREIKAACSSWRYIDNTKSIESVTYLQRFPTQQEDPECWERKYTYEWHANPTRALLIAASTAPPFWLMPTIIMPAIELEQHINFCHDHLEKSCIQIIVLPSCYFVRPSQQKRRELVLCGSLWGFSKMPPYSGDLWSEIIVQIHARLLSRSHCLCCLLLLD